MLNKPALNGVADRFLQSADEWEKLTTMGLPNDVPLLGEARALLGQKRDTLRAGGPSTATAITKINDRLAEIKGACAADFPLNQEEVETLREQLAAQVQVIHDVEFEAVSALKNAMG